MKWLAYYKIDMKFQYIATLVLDQEQKTNIRNKKQKIKITCRNHPFYPLSLKDYPYPKVGW